MSKSIRCGANKLRKLPVFAAVTGLLAVCVLSAGCRRAVIPVAPTETREESVDALVGALGTGVTPVPVYEKVYTAERLVSIVAEGFAEEETIRALTDQLKAEGLPAVFFLSYVDVSDYPDAAKHIVSSGLEIGNYGLDGEKNMQNNTAAQNARSFSRTQAAILAATGKSPDYVRCNGSQYTEQLRELAAICGLKAAVQPNEFLNYRSFASYTGARNYVRKIQRGSIISIKLGQELDDLEFKGPGEPSDEKPAIDKKPSITSENLHEEGGVSQGVIQGLSWLIEALRAERYTIVSLEALQKADQSGADIVHPLDEAERALYDASSYTVPVTNEPLGEAETTAAPDSYFDGAVFVGDSATMKLEAYVNYQRQTNPTFFGTARFLTNSSLGVGNALWLVSDDSAHPVFEGTATAVEDAIGRMGDVRRVYLMLGINDIGVYEVDEYLDNYRTLIGLIQKAAPNADICVESILPGSMNRTTAPGNGDIFRFDLALAAFCRERGYRYIDVASALRDASGALTAAYCQDPAGTGLRLNDSAAIAWIDYLRTHAADQAAAGQLLPDGTASGETDGEPGAAQTDSHPDESLEG